MELPPSFLDDVEEDDEEDKLDPKPSSLPSYLMKQARSHQKRHEEVVEHAPVLHKGECPIYGLEPTQNLELKPLKKSTLLHTLKEIMSRGPNSPACTITPGENAKLATDHNTKLDDSQEDIEKDIDTADSYMSILQFLQQRNAASQE